jgi:hypothetical protein
VVYLERDRLAILDRCLNSLGLVGLSNHCVGCRSSVLEGPSGLRRIVLCTHEKLLPHHTSFARFPGISPLGNRLSGFTWIKASNSGCGF